MGSINKIGIFAYGSLIDDPGIEIAPLICERISDVLTPFKVEFSRKSKSRDYAPTLIPVENGGAYVKGVIILLDESCTLEEAKNLLWRRETRNESTGKAYPNPKVIGTNTVVVKVLESFNNIDCVLYTKIGANIDDLTPSILADLAISSAKSKSGREKLDGISYLISAKENGIATPLMLDYENEIVSKTGTLNLIEALRSCCI